MCLSQVVVIVLTELTLPSLRWALSAIKFERAYRALHVPGALDADRAPIRAMRAQDSDTHRPHARLEVAEET